MKPDNEELIHKALEAGADRAAIIDVKKIIFSEDLRRMCEQNACGKYGTNWVCPPGVGSLEAMKTKVCSFKYGLVFQSVKRLEDSFDFEGMMNAKYEHEVILRRIFERVKNELHMEDLFPLSAGACSICEKCAYTRGEKCLFPDKAFPSVEACGIDVKALVESCVIPYHNGKDTVSYVGVILFKSKYSN